MSTPRRWWAVWDAENPEDGSLHVRATSRASAIRKYLAHGNEDVEDLVAKQVDAATHKAWQEDDS